MLASGLSCGMVNVWKESGYLNLTVRGHKDVVTSIKWKPDDVKLFISASRDKVNEK
jgi:WD40 repeat protein